MPSEPGLLFLFNLPMAILISSSVGGGTSTLSSAAVESIVSRSWSTSLASSSEKYSFHLSRTSVSFVKGFLPYRFHA